MVNDENEQLGATTATNNDHPDDENSQGSEEESALPVDFGPFLDTPSLEDVSKKFQGKRNESLAPTVASHPSIMMDIILQHTGKMLDLFQSTMTKNEAQLKLNSSTANGRPYIPQSQRKTSTIVAPNNMQGNDRIESFVEEGRDTNERHKEENASIIRRMNRAVEEETWGLIQEQAFQAIQDLSEDLTICCNSVASRQLNIRLELEDLAFLAGKKFLLSDEGEDLLDDWRCTENDIRTAVLKYRALVKMQGVEERVKELMNYDADALIHEVSERLVPLMTEMTTSLWNIHEKKEQVRKMNAELAERKKIRAQKKKQDEMQARIAQQEQEDREALDNGQLPNSWKKMVVSATETHVKKMHQQERLKSSGDDKSQESKPTKGGTKGRKTSNKSTKKSRGKSKRQQSEQRNQPGRTELNESAGRGLGRGRGGRGGRGRGRGGRGRGRGQQQQQEQDDSNSVSSASSRRSSRRPGRGRGRGRGNRGGSRDAGRGGGRRRS